MWPACSLSLPRALKRPSLATQGLDGGRLNKDTCCPFYWGHCITGEEGNPIVAKRDSPSRLFLQLMTWSSFNTVEVVTSPPLPRSGQSHCHRPWHKWWRLCKGCLLDLTVHTVTLSQDGTDSVQKVVLTGPATLQLMNHLVTIIDSSRATFLLTPRMTEWNNINNIHNKKHKSLFSYIE